MNKCLVSVKTGTGSPASFSLSDWKSAVASVAKELHVSNIPHHMTVT